jgi:hypothetical protein
MKVIGIEYGRVSLLVDLVDLGTRTGVYLPEATSFVQNRYAFVHVPSVPQASQNQQIYRFEQGRIMKGQKQYSISSFEIHPHGLVVQGTDTDAAEHFLEDFFRFGAEHLAMKNPERAPAKVFLSAIVIEFGADTNKLLTKWRELSKLLSTQIEKQYNVKEPVQISRLAMQPDPQNIPPRLSVLLNEFIIERRIYEPYNHQRYFSAAPLRTDDHIALLQKFEEIAL